MTTDDDERTEREFAELKEAWRAASPEERRRFLDNFHGDGHFGGTLDEIKQMLKGPTTITNDEIVRLANLGNSIIEEDDPRGEAYSRDLGEIGLDVMWVNMAMKLLMGRGYSITSDNPKTIARAKSLAQHMGATIEERGSNTAITWITKSGHYDVNFLWHGDVDLGAGIWAKPGSTVKQQNGPTAVVKPFPKGGRHGR